MSKLLAARINNWQEFKIRKIAEYKNLSIAEILNEAIQVYSRDFPETLINQWLEEYKKLNEVD